MLLMLIDTGFLSLLLFRLHLLGRSGPPAGGRFGPAGGAAGGGRIIIYQSGQSFVDKKATYYKSPY